MSIMSRALARIAAPPVPPAARIEPVVAQPGAARATSVDPAPTQAGWGGFVTMGAGTRVRSLPPVTPVIAQRHATVFACCNIIAGDLSKVPLQVWQRDGGGRETLVREHVADYLLNTEASPGVPGMIARFAMVYAYTLRGRAYAWTPRDGAGELAMLEAIRPDLCAELSAGRQRFYDFTDMDGVQRRVPMRAMVHLRYMAEDGWTGRSPLEVAAESIGLALAGQEAAARAASGVHMKAVLKMADVYENEEDYRRNARRIRAAITDPEANGVPIIGPEDDITSLDMKASDQELLASRKFDREQIAAAYRMPPAKLQMLEHGVKANGQQQAIDYKTDCLLHWGRFVEAQMGLGILTEDERRAGLVLRHNYEALMEATTKERFEAARLAVGGPVQSWQEWRRDNGYPDLPAGEAPYPPPNMTRADVPATQEGPDNAA